MPRLSRILPLSAILAFASQAYAQQPAQPDPETAKKIMAQQAEMMKIMFEPKQSRLGFEETVKALTSSAQREGWDVKTSLAMGAQASEGAQQGATKVHVFFMCPPAHFQKIEKDDRLKTMASVMPCRYTVYQVPDGKVFIASVNNAKMSEMLGGEVGKLIADAGAAEKKLLKGIIQ
jgi:uncharacterized protein (DUF302 family)